MQRSGPNTSMHSFMYGPPGLREIVGRRRQAAILKVEPGHQHTSPPNFTETLSWRASLRMK